jgi:exonuclease III
LANWIKKEDTIICCLQETHFFNRNKHWPRVKGWKKIYQANGPPKTGRSGNTYIRQVDFKLTLIEWDKEGQFILIKGEIHQKEITIINLYSPNISVPNFIKHTLKDLKAHIDSRTLVMGNLNTPPSEDPRWRLGCRSRQHKLHESKTLLRCWSHTWQK